MCGKIEIKREELDGEIKMKLDSSARLAFYPSTLALKAAVLADKVVLNMVTSDFVDKFIQIVNNSFDSGLSVAGKKASHAHGNLSEIKLHALTKLRCYLVFMKEYMISRMP